jgi:hypothetical protein
MRNSGRGCGCARNDQGQKPKAKAISVRRNASLVGMISSTASRCTRSGRSSASRYAHRPPRSCPATEKRSKPRCCIKTTIIACHGPLRIRGVVGRRARFAASPVAAEISSDHGEVLGEPRSHFVPSTCVWGNPCGRRGVVRHRLAVPESSPRRFPPSADQSVRTTVASARRA